jgi:SAM-dependent methyltransferase
MASPDQKSPKEFAVPGVHVAAHKLLEPLPRGKIYDLAAGAGALSAWARDRGFDVTAVDIDDSAFARKDIPFIAANLNAPFPMPDASADVVAAIEVIEHLENHFAFLREAARVLRPGGFLVLSTPNEHNIQNRWAYFRTGFYGDSREVIREDDPALPMRHIHMAPLPQLELAWRRAGFEFEKLEVSRLRRWAFLLLPLMYPVQTVSLRLRMRWRVKDPESRALARRLYPLMNDPRMFLGRVAVFLLRKKGEERK